MRPSLSRRLSLPLVLFVVLPVRTWAQEPPATDPGHAVAETIQVTATRVPEDVEGVPASVTVISGDELRARGANNLPSALGNREMRYLGSVDQPLAPNGIRGLSRPMQLYANTPFSCSC